MSGLGVLESSQAWGRLWQVCTPFRRVLSKSGGMREETECLSAGEIHQGAGGAQQQAQEDLFDGQSGGNAPGLGGLGQEV